MRASLLPRSWSTGGPVASDVDGAERTLAILGGARAIVARGWLQGGWYVLEKPDGRRRLVGAGSMAARRSGIVVEACLVGAVVEAARRHSPARGTSGPALDALWCALEESEGGPQRAGTRAPSPGVRALQVHVLAGWNDEQGRGRDDVLGLIDRAIRAVQTGQPAPAAPASPDRSR